MPKRSCSRLPAVMARTGLSRSTIYAEIAAGRFPRPIALAGGYAKAWLDDEIDSYLDERVAERDGEQPAAA